MLWFAAFYVVRFCRARLLGGDVGEHRQFDDEERAAGRRSDLADLGAGLNPHVRAGVFGLAALPRLAVIGDRAVDQIADLRILFDVGRNLCARR